jgi:hypothetical protein
MSITNAIKNLRRNLTNQNALANLSDVNLAVSEASIKTYQIPTYSGKLQGNVATTSIPVSGIESLSSVFMTTITEDVTNALVAGKKLNIGELSSQGIYFNISNIKVTIGVGAAIWDGGDLELYLGNSKIATLSAATIISGAGGVVGTSQDYLLKVADTIKIGSGTYDAVDGAVTTPSLIFNVRLSGETTLFSGMIHIEIVTDVKIGSAGCGSWCGTTCDYGNPASQLYCSYIKGGCANCPPTLGIGSFIAPDVQNV